MRRELLMGWAKLMANELAGGPPALRDGCTVKVRAGRSILSQGEPRPPAEVVGFNAISPQVRSYSMVFDDLRQI